MSIAFCSKFSFGVPCNASHVFNVLSFISIVQAETFNSSKSTAGSDFLICCTGLTHFSIVQIDLIRSQISNGVFSFGILLLLSQHIVLLFHAIFI
jgi:hypothetical protein